MTNRKSILITTWTFPPEANGVSHVAAAHAEGLAALGNDVTVVTSCHPERVSNGNVKVVQFETGGNFRQGFYGDIEGYCNFISAFKGDAILIQCWASWNCELALRAFQNTRAKKIMVSHGVSFNLGGLRSRMKWRPYKLQMENKLKAFDHIVFLAEKADQDRFYDKFIMEQLGLKSWSIIPNGTYPEKFNGKLPDFKEAFGMRKKKQMILCISSYGPDKNQEMAVRAFKRADRKDAVLVFIGNSVNKYTRKVKRIAHRALKDAESVVFLDNIDQQMIASAYRAADLFLCPSKTEVQPLMVLDAMASGTPFISTDVGSVSEFPGGVIVHSTAEMALAMVELLGDASKMKSLKREAQRACEEKYSWKEVTHKYDVLLDRVLSC